MSKIFINDSLVDTKSVQAPVLSRGFAFGFGVFETIKFMNCRPCFFREHLARLQKAAANAGFTIELDENEMRARLTELFRVEGVRDGVFKIVISDLEGLDRPTVVIYIRTVGAPNLDSVPLSLGSSKLVKASLAFSSRHKSMNYMDSILELERVKALGFDECVFQNEKGQLTECAVANLFFTKGDVLMTPNLECGLLDGIVRSKVISIARRQGIEVREGFFQPEELSEADEIFVSSSGNGPRPVESFTDLLGNKFEQGSVFLPKLKSAFEELERQDVLNAD